MYAPHVQVVHILEMLVQMECPSLNYILQKFFVSKTAAKSVLCNSYVIEVSKLCTIQIRAKSCAYTDTCLAETRSIVASSSASNLT